MAEKETRKKVLGICVSHIHDSTIQQTVINISNNAIKRDIKTVIYNTFNDLFNNDNDSIGASSIFNNICAEKLDGLVILPESIKNDTIVKNLIAQAKKADIPTVCVDAEHEGCFSVLYDYSDAFEQIVEHVITVHKCTRINMLAGFKGNDFSEERIRVFRKVLERHGIEFDERRLGYGDFWSIPAKKAVGEFIDSGLPLPEAIVCANDSMAIAACEELYERGYNVPDDIIITGFDGIEQEKYHTPRLCTAYQDLNAASEAIVRLIDESIEDRSKPICSVKIPYELGFSQSCGCKPIEYVNVNKLVMSLYEANVLKNEFLNQMNVVSSRMTNCNDIVSSLSHISTQLGYLYADSFTIALRDSVFSNHDLNQSYEDNIAVNEPMRIILRRKHDDFNTEQVMFNYGETPECLSDMFENVTSVLISPINFQDQVFGFIIIGYYPEVLQYERVYTLSIELNHILDTIIKKSCIMSVNSRLTEINHQLEEMYVRDSMTGLYNRRGFYRELTKLSDEYMEKNAYIFVASIDLDGLKYINDNFGHQDGDFAIKSIGDIISSLVGESGITARFGGDEYMAVVFSETPVDAVAFEASLMDKINTVNTTSGKPYQFGASCGMEQALLNYELDIDVLMKNADDKMYTTKSEHKKFRDKARV